MIKRLLLGIAALALLAPAWLLATEAGLRAAVAVANRATGGQLTVGAAEGRLIGDVFLRDFAYRTETVSVEIDRAEVNLRLPRLLLGRIQAERLALGTLSVTTRPGPAPVGTPPPRTALTVRTPVRLAIEEGRIDTMRLRLASWQREWVLTEARLGARWRDEWMVIGALRATTSEAGPVELRGRLAIVDDLLLLEDIEAQGPATLRAQGALALSDGVANALDVAWEGLELPGGMAPGFASARGGARLEGLWSGFAWRTQAELQLQGVPGQLAAHGRGTLRGLDIEAAELKALEGGLRGAGRLDWSPRLVTKLTLAWHGLNPGSAWPAWAGVLNGEGRLDARWGAPTQLDFDVELRDSCLRDYPFALRASGRTEDRRVFLSELALQSGASTLAARGQLLPEMGLSGELRSPDLRALWAGLSGSAELRATAAGPFAAPRITAKGTVDNVIFGGLRVTHGALDAQLASRGSSRITLDLNGIEAGTALRSLRFEGSGTRGAHRVQLAVQAREANARLALEGGERAGAWRGRLVEAVVQPPRGAPWRLEEAAPLSFAARVFESDPACLAAASGGDGRACAQLRVAPGRQRIAFRLREFDLQHLRAWLPDEWNAVGALTGSAALSVVNGELTELRADLAASAGFIEGGGVRLDYGPASLEVGPDGDKLHAKLQLRPAGGEVTGEIWVSPGRALIDRPMLGDLRLRLPDLTWLPVLSPEIASAHGALDADLGISGTMRSPSLDGRVNLREGRVQLTTPGIELTGITASFERARDAPLSLKAQARSGDGTLEIAGKFATLQPKLAGELTIRGKDVLGVNRPDIRAWLSPDLTLALDGRNARLTGELVVPRADITPSELQRGGVSPSGDQIIIETEQEAIGAGGGLRVESEVKIVLGDQVRFDGLGLKTRLAGGITAYDDPQRPTRGRGELRLEGGRYKAYAQELQIESGRLIFSGGPVTDPAIDITAIRKPREDIKVGLRARGTLDAPEFTLFSEPAMSQEEQLSWLVLGRSLSATLDSNQRTQMSSAAVSLGLTGGEYLAQQLAPKLGVDEVSLGAKPGESTDLARFTIGKYLSPKLFVSYGYGLFQPGHFFRMQYDIGKRFKLVGETGMQQGGDLLYTIER